MIRHEQSCINFTIGLHNVPSQKNEKNDSVELWHPSGPNRALELAVEALRQRSLAASHMCPVLPSPHALPPCLRTASYVSVCVCALVYACVCVSAVSELC